MEFSQEEVYLIGAGLTLVVSLPLYMLLGKYSLKWFWSHERRISFNENIVNIVIGSVLTVIILYALLKVVEYASVVWIIGIGGVLESIVLLLYLRSLNSKYHKTFSSLIQDKWTKFSGHKLNVIVYSLLGGYLVYCVAIGIVCVSFVAWVMPDVVVVENGSKRAWYEYKVRDYYVFPWERGLKPGCSYIDNQSKDTIYRVVVNYGYIGEDKYNYYTVNAKYAPNTLSKMPHREIHVMDTIAPVMPASYTKKTGKRYHTQRVYLTDYEHLWDFKILNTRKFGIERNKWVDSIRETKNRVLKEGSGDYRAYKKIDSLPYPRLRPIPEKQRKVIPNE